MFHVDRRQYGIGAIGHVDDSYLLENRNQTKKWDEYTLSSARGSIDAATTITAKHNVFDRTTKILLF